MPLTPHEREVRAAERRAYIEQDIRDHIDRIVAEAPMPSEAQIARLRALLGPTLREAVREIQERGR